MTSKVRKVERHPLALRWCPECRAEVGVERYERLVAGKYLVKANCCPRCGTECERQRPDASPGVVMRRTGDREADGAAAEAAHRALREKTPTTQPGNDLYPPEYKP